MLYVSVFSLLGCKLEIKNTRSYWYIDLLIEILKSPSFLDFSELPAGHCLVLCSSYLVTRHLSPSESTVSQSLHSPGNMILSAFLINFCLLELVTSDPNMKSEKFFSHEEGVQLAFLVNLGSHLCVIWSLSPILSDCDRIWLYRDSDPQELGSHCGPLFEYKKSRQSW